MNAVAKESLLLALGFVFDILLLGFLVRPVSPKENKGAISKEERK
jgi:hypothetical protein